jgi:hypothetical protein
MFNQLNQAHETIINLKLIQIKFLKILNIDKLELFDFDSGVESQLPILTDTI